PFPGIAARRQKVRIRAGRNQAPSAIRFPACALRRLGPWGTRGMSDSSVRVGTVRPRYTSTGRLSSYSLELWHDGLGEHREVKSSDPDVLENKAEAILLKWEEKWQAKQQKLALLATAESAAEETVAAQAALAECETL